MDKFTPEYIQNVQQIIKNDEKDKARELLKDLHPADIAGTISTVEPRRSRVYLHAFGRGKSGRCTARTR